MGGLIRTVMDLMLRVANYGTKAGLAVAGVQAWQLYQRGNVTPEDATAYVATPLVVGISSEVLAAIVAVVRGQKAWDYAAVMVALQGLRKYFAEVPDAKPHLDELAKLAWVVDSKIEPKKPDETVSQRIRDALDALLRLRVKPTAAAVVLVAGSVCTMAGCVPPLPEPGPRPGPIEPDKPEPVKPADRAAICDELADMIPARIKTTDDLVRVLQLLSDGGDWKSDDSSAIDAAIPGLTTAKRALTVDDATKLRGIK